MELVQNTPVSALKSMLRDNLREITINGKTLSEVGYDIAVGEDWQDSSEIQNKLIINSQATYDKPMYSDIKNRSILTYRVATLTLTLEQQDRLESNQGLTEKILNTLLVMIDDTSSLENNILHVAKTSTPRSAGDDLNGNSRYQCRIKYIYQGEI